MTWLPWLGLALCLLAAAAVSLSAYGAKRWIDTTRTLTRRLEAGQIDETARPPSPARFDLCELDGLPAPVQRYFRVALKDGQPIIAAATIELAGRFNLSATGEQWKPFTSRQRVVTRRPGFLWDAEVSMLPGLAVCVRDGYIAGQGVRWEAVDDRSAHASIVDGPLRLTLLFSFNDAGLIDSARGAMVGKEMVMLPWEGSWSDYQVQGGMTVPFTGEAAWLRSQGRKPYFVGAVTSLTYEFAP